jgi:glyoxylase-like metal-dependent hydrolase (beta-lactamase superfamily II)
MADTKHVTWTLITCALTLTLCTTASAQELPFTLTEVGPDVWAAIGGSNPATASNAGFVIGDDGVVVIDTFTSAAGAKQLLAEIRWMPGHTGGDSVVTIPAARVVFTGDLFWHRGLPNLIDATTASWIETLGTLSARGSDSAFVSGHGGVGRAADVTAFRDYLATLRRLVSEARARRVTGEALAAAVRPTLAGTYGQWDFFEYLAAPNILQVEEELNGTKRIPR